MVRQAKEHKRQINLAYVNTAVTYAGVILCRSTGALTFAVLYVMQASSSQGLLINRSVNAGTMGLGAVRQMPHPQKETERFHLSLTFLNATNLL